MEVRAKVDKMLSGTVFFKKVQRLVLDLLKEHSG